MLLPETLEILLFLQFLLVDATSWVRCSNWHRMSTGSESGGRGDADSCRCVEIAQGRFAWGVVESCASEALQHATSAETAWIVFHVGTDDEALGQGRCIVERCFGQCVGASRHRHASSLVDEVRSFVPQEMCPEGSSVILPELGALGGADGVLRPEAAELEFLRLFGPLKLQNQTLQSLRMECIETAHRAVAKVCLQDGCDEWSKYSLPRCQVSLGLPYDFGDSAFLYSPSCERSGQYYCPPGLPLSYLWQAVREIRGNSRGQPHKFDNPCRPKKSGLERPLQPHFPPEPQNPFDAQPSSNLKS